MAARRGAPRHSAGDMLNARDRIGGHRRTSTGDIGGRPTAAPPASPIDRSAVQDRRLFKGSGAPNAAQDARVAVSRRQAGG